MKQKSPLMQIPGIGEKTAALMEKAGILTLDDLIHYYPRDYDRFEPAVPIREITKDGIITINATVLKRPDVKLTSKIKLVSSVLTDGTGEMKAVWFNMPYLSKTLRPGGRYIFRGKVIRGRGGFTMEQPVIMSITEYEKLLHTRMPVYSLTKGLTNKTLQKAVSSALEMLGVQKEYLPDRIRRDNQLAEYNFALRTIHFPKDEQELLYARRRLVFDEFFLFALSLRMLKGRNEKKENGYEIPIGSHAKELMRSLPYELTGSQRLVLSDMEKDMTGPHLMNRLVQGDVGSGKTILAVLAMLSASEKGFQSAMMAPTEVLARQHFQSVTKLIEQYNLPYKAVLLVGSMTAKNKREAYRIIAEHKASIIIGTHALIQESVEYDKLALVITDEQHRFGVNQREVFSSKGKEPHVLVMSATPIPRTLAIILYGDLDISVIDELPAKRLPIKNCVVDTSYRPNAYRFIEKEVKNGRQCYVICPMVEESELMEGENVTDYSKKLQEQLPSDITVGMLHGKMHASEKDKIMTAFAANEIQVLVSTTVVEVGVDVPNATVMMIENAERFGLAQLHQLRGRVGRGSYQSYCIFVNGSGDSEKNKRLDILNKSNDGFYIASEDLKLRGPGDLFGIRQSGDLEFALGDIYNDAKLLQAASEEAEKLMDRDPFFELDENQGLKRKLDAEMERRIKKCLLL